VTAITNPEDVAMYGIEDEPVGVISPWPKDAPAPLIPSPWWQRSGMFPLLGGLVTSMGAVVAGEMTLRSWCAAALVAVGAFLTAIYRRRSVAVPRADAP